ncbi:hypothetical protein [Microbulbifer sp. HZ11]|uniref:hypothetical protein n=1 Tax=Microbulbifer sp. HZ11 TaxID=1453501 RepID=UPI0005BBB823|nr:hypothetical protein [Microbulbifer sp. HZ11]
MVEVKISEDIVSHVEGLISSGEEVVQVIKFRLLEGEEEQYDDELIDSIVQEFSESLKRLASALDEKYGEHKFSSSLDGLDDEIEDEFYVPCSYVSAVWEREDYILYLAVSQEDREYPIALVVGIEH